jgi:plasmid stabilization system protein ParE
MNWTARPQVDDDLIAGRNFILPDNPRSARAFLDAAFALFDRLAQFPEMGARTRLKHRRLKALRYFVMPPPFNRWLVFYEPRTDGVEIVRVIYGTMNWKETPELFQ